MFSPREVAELHHEKTQLLGENASLKKGLEFLLGRHFRLPIAILPQPVPLKH